MTSIDFRKIKTLLPWGSIIRISAETGISPQIVSSVFIKGWYPQYHGKIVASALSILDESNIDPDILKHAEELKLTTVHPIFVSPALKTGKRVSGKSAWGNNEDKDSDNLDKLDWDGMVALIKKIKLKVDPDDFGIKPFSTEQGREEQLRYAVWKELHPDAEE